MALRIGLAVAVVLIVLLSVSQCQKLQRDALIAESGQATAEGGMQAAHDANQILDGARDRDVQIILKSEKNRDAILKAPGADAPLNPGLIAALNGGLCSYASTPGCDGLRGEHSPELPDADRGREPLARRRDGGGAGD